MTNYFITIDEEKARQMNPLTLAFVGDSVHTLYVRSKLATLSDAKANKLHNLASKKVSAVSQAEFFGRLESAFTQAESDIYHRARNSKSHSTAKNASVAEYRVSSGVEAVFGYLYLIGNFERLAQLLEMQ